MDAAAFLAQLRQKRFAPAYLLLGEDVYLRDLCLETLLAAALPAQTRELAVIRLSLKEATWGGILEHAGTLPLLAPRQVLVVSDLERLSEPDLDALASYLRNPNPATLLVFAAEQLDRRTRLAQLLLDTCEVVEVASPTEEREAQAAARRFAQELGLHLEPAAAEELVWAVGLELGQLRRELEKLRAYLGPSGTVRTEDIAAVVVPARRFSVFDLVELLAERQRPQALARIRRLLEQGESPIGIVGLLAWLYRQLLQAKDLPPRTSLAEARQRLRLPPGRAETLLRQAQHFDRQELQQAFQLLREADWALKSSPPDPVALLEVLLLRLTSAEERALAR